MTTPVIVVQFGPNGEPFTVDLLNSNFGAIVTAINSLAADTILQLGVTPGMMTGYMPITGGTFYGQITTPSILIGPVAGPQYPAVTANDSATPGARGVVYQAGANADAAASAVVVAAANAGTQSGVYVQADVQSIATLANELKADLTQLVADHNALRASLNALQAALRAAGVVAT